MSQREVTALHKIIDVADASGIVAVPNERHAAVLDAAIDLDVAFGNGRTVEHARPHDDRLHAGQPAR